MKCKKINSVIKKNINQYKPYKIMELIKEKNCLIKNRSKLKKNNQIYSKSIDDGQTK